MSKPVYVLGGPNLNLLGSREPEIYGRDTLEDIHQRLRTLAGSTPLELRQTNHEGELVTWIQEASASGSALILNAADPSQLSGSSPYRCQEMRPPLGQQACTCCPTSGG